MTPTAVAPLPFQPAVRALIEASFSGSVANRHPQPWLDDLDLYPHSRFATIADAGHHLMLKAAAAARLVEPGRQVREFMA